jgi:hypothetical protein
MDSEESTLPVTIDKSHIVTIGERLYTESIELIRELVNNAYDADATRVDVNLSTNKIEVKDNGSGMDHEGLKQYFSIGSQEKVVENKSPKFQRDRIGQFGIGKFATLSACECFEVYTQKDNFAARVTFDKDLWSKYSDSWHLPLKILQPDTKREDGTTVILSKLNRNFDEANVRRRILESVPIRAKNFAVFVNGRRVVDIRIPGHRIPILDGTKFGTIHGEIIIVGISQASPLEMGIQVRVKGVMVKREYFGIQTWGKEGTRVRGEVNADFLPVTSDRSGFRTDSDEYQVFHETMTTLLTDVKKQLNRLSDVKDTKKIRRALKEVLDRIQTALIQNPELGDIGFIPTGEPTNGLGEPAEIKSKPEEEEIEIDIENDNKESDVDTENEQSVDETGKKLEKPKVKRLTPSAVVRKMKIGNLAVACCLDYFGEDGPECFTEGGIVYINREHPLYKRESKKRVTHTMHLARLLTQEISLMRDPENPREAYNRQSKLLRSAFKDMKEQE